MGNGAKLALVIVLAMIVLVVAVWDRQNEERHQEGVKDLPAVRPLDPKKPGPKVKVVMQRPAAQDRMSGEITPGALSIHPGGKTPIVRKGDVAPVAPARGTTVVETPAPIPAPPAAPPGKRYVLKASDTLTAIALREYGQKNAWKRIQDANKDLLKDPSRLPIGKEILIPPMEVAQMASPAASVVKPALSHTTEIGTLPAGARRYTVEKGDTLGKIAQKTLGSKDKWKVIFDANRDKLTDEASVKAGQELVIPSGK